MAELPNNIHKQHILEAIDRIDKEGIPSDAKSQYYDLLFNGNRYPPKYVISLANEFANGETLPRTSFRGGRDTEAFKLLESLGFKIIEKNFGENKVWIEKLYIKGNPDKISGPRALGKVLWSAQRDKRGGDIYKNMREVKAGDRVLHLIDNESFIGVSVVKEPYREITVNEGSVWDGDAYVVELEDYTVFDAPLKRELLFIEANYAELKSIAEESEVFYRKDFNLRQGAYLTPCPHNLLKLINSAYYLATSKNLPNLNSFNLSDDSAILHKEVSLESFKEDLKKSGLFYSEKLVDRFIGALITKPFVLLTGLSGSGKTKLAQSFVKWICADSSQYRIIPVGADWTNREPLLGYPDALQPGNYVHPDNKTLQLLIDASKTENRRKPYFLILDEMNLSHVERYFADFLSAMESGEPIHLYSERDAKSDHLTPNQIVLPKNLYIIGTVNIDETTYMFSPKVLDRASVIEFRVSVDDISQFLKQSSLTKFRPFAGEGAGVAYKFLEMATEQDFSVEAKSQQVDTLIKFFTELKKVGGEFGYRSALEIQRFIAVMKETSPSWSDEMILDAVILQKLLPKLHGSRRKLEPILKSLIKLCLKDPDDYENSLAKSNELEALQNLLRYPESFEKLKRMYTNLVDNGFSSFAEA